MSLGKAPMRPKRPARGRGLTVAAKRGAASAAADARAGAAAGTTPQHRPSNQVQTINISRKRARVQKRGCINRRAANNQRAQQRGKMLEKNPFSAQAEVL